MEYLHTFLLAVLMAFLGFLPPGMINMTALKRGMEHGRGEAVKFILGAVTVILLQAFIAVTFAQFLVRNPQIIDWLTYAAIAVFLGLAIYFFRQARRLVDISDAAGQRNPFWGGLALSSMNMLAVPFFLSYSTLLEAGGWLRIDPPHNFVFALGATAGSFLLFFGYVWFAEFIQRRVQFIARNINYILALLFLGLAAVTGYNVLL
jgi:threonine/homoserine/homoserine lactone efflux protein